MIRHFLFICMAVLAGCSLLVDEPTATLDAGTTDDLVIHWPGAAGTHDDHTDVASSDDATETDTAIDAGTGIAAEESDGATATEDTGPSATDSEPGSTDLSDPDSSTGSTDLSDPGSDSVTETSIPDSATEALATDSAQPSDTGDDTEPVCVPVTELQGNGVDDDCDGLVDEQDDTDTHIGDPCPWPYVCMQAHECSWVFDNPTTFGDYSCPNDQDFCCGETPT